MAKSSRSKAGKDEAKVDPALTPALTDNKGAAPGQSFEDFTSQQVAKYSVTDAALADLAAKYAGLTVVDEDTYKKAKEAKRELVPLRTGVEATRKELKAIALEYGRKIDTEAKRITTELEKIENPIDAEIKAWDDKAEIERQRVENEKIERAKAWIGTIVDLGVLYNHQTGQYYYFDQENRPILNLTLEEIKELSDQEIAFVTENLEASFKIAQDRKAEEDRLKQEEADRQEQQRKENERLAEENRLAAEKLANEKKEIEDALYEARSAKLVAAGFFPVSDQVADILLFHNPSGKISVLREEIVGVPKDTWTTTEAKVLADVAALKTKEEERLAEDKRKEEEAENQRKENERLENERKDNERIENERVANLLKLRRAVLETAGVKSAIMNLADGHLYNLDDKKIVALSDQDFDKVVGVIKAGLEKHASDQAAEKLRLENEEKQRLADLAPDKEKLKAITAALGAIVVPELKTKRAQTVGNGARELIQKANAWITQEIAKMK